MLQIIFCWFLIGHVLISQALAETITSPTSPWTPRVQFSGDVRYRMVNVKQAADEAHSFQQLRLRAGVAADVNEDARVIARMATGTSAISADQTLGDSNDPGMARRSFGLDLAYIDYHFLEYGAVWLGRTADPFFRPGKAQLVWDEDLAFEGLAISWEPHWSHSSAFLHLADYMVSENYVPAKGAASGQDLVDQSILGAEIGYAVNGEDWSLTTHLANYHFLNIQNVPISRFESQAAVDPYSSPYSVYRGNTVYPDDPLNPSTPYFFQYKYILLEAGTEWSQKIGNFQYNLWLDWVKNTQRAEQNIGVEVGGSLTWKWARLTLAQMERQMDAVVGAFTDSDTNGGGADNKGTRVALSVAIGPNARFTFTQFQARRGVATVARSYSSSFMDLSVTF